MKKQNILTAISVAIIIALVVTLYFQIDKSEQYSNKEYRFVMIPIVKHAWFDIVYDASVEASKQLEQELGVHITVEYEALDEFSLIAQSDLLAKIIASEPDGIAIDCIDSKSQLPLLNEAKRRGIPIILFASYPPEGELIPHIGNDFYEQGMFAGKELLKRINYTGQVAILHGVPTNTPHVQRYTAYKELFEQYPEIEVVANEFDYDVIDNAYNEATKIIAEYPDLAGFAVCNAAGPVGVGMAIKDAEKIGEIQYVGIDDLPQLQELMREGVVDLSIATQPNMIGEWCTVSLLMTNIGIKPAIWYDTKYGILTPDMLEDGVRESF
jgi:ribose transport system substrate-binding protein